MSIFKESFKENLKTQLKYRQEAMLKRDSKDVIYINSRNSWIRMSSSVNVLKSNVVPEGINNTYTIDQLKNLGNYDNSLAKKYILQGGILNEDGTVKVGIGNDFTNLYSRKSAEGNDYRLGIRPMPGITGIEIKSLGAYGSLRQVTVNFNCWDIRQLEDLELLYMRPGYSVLIEWGWAPYLDNNGNLVSNVDFYNIIDNPSPKEQIWKDLDKKMDVDGNYEAMFGLIKNYSWTARMDGGYDCTVEIISYGEIIESLKVNYTPSLIIEKIKDTGFIAKNLKDASTDFDEEEIKSAYNRNILAGIFYELYKIGEKKSSNGNNDGESYSFEDTKYKTTYNFFHKTININKEDKENDKKVGQNDEQHYISLSSLVDILNKYVLLQSKDIGTNTTPFALLSVIDDKSGLTPNKETGDGYLLALAHPLQVSVDPRVCLIKNKVYSNLKVNLIPGPSGVNPDNSSSSINISFSHNLGNADSFVDTLIALAAATNIDALNNDSQGKKDLAKVFKDRIQGPEGKRYSSNQVLENIKEIARLWKLKYAQSEAGSYVVLSPNSSDITRYGLSLKKENVGKKIDIGGAFVGDPSNFFDLLEDDYAFNFDDTLTKDILVPEGENTDEFVKAAKSDPEKEEQEKLEKKQEELKDYLDDAKKGAKFLDNITPPYFINDKWESELGIIGNIFISLKMLYEISLDNVLESQDKKEKNEIALYDFVKNIMARVSTAIGNVNNFDLFVDPSNNVAKIIDINYVDRKEAENVYKEAFQLEMHTLGSTVRSYKLESKIFQEQSNIVAIGAQVSGGTLGVDTTSLVAFNRNIIDRIIPEKTSPAEDSLFLNAKEKKDALLANLETLFKFFADLKSGGFSFDSDFDASKAEDYANALKDLIEYFKSISTSRTSNRAILPTILSVEMDGIGGLIIGTIFKIDPELLPKGYKGVGNSGIGSNLGYVMTGIGHSVNNSGDWITKIDAQTIILDPPNPNLQVIDYNNITININPTTESDIVQTTTISITEKPIVASTGIKVKTGGATKVIDGKVRENGKIDDLLVPIRQDLYSRHYSSVNQSDDKRIRLQASAIQNLEKLLTDAWTAGIYIKVNSAYRTREDQERIKADSAKTGIPAATPGTSNHGFGLAVDLGNKSGVRINPNKTPKEWAWIQANKSKYKFQNINDNNESHHYNFLG